jgi:hypothetical protein
VAPDRDVIFAYRDGLARVLDSLRRDLCTPATGRLTTSAITPVMMISSFGMLYARLSQPLWAQPAGGDDA